MKSITLKFANGRVQRPSFGQIKDTSDLRNRTEKLEIFKSLENDLAHLKDAADAFQALDGMEREASRACKMVAVKREGFLSQLFFGDKEVEQCENIPAVKDEEPAAGVVLSEVNELGAQAFLDYSPEEFDCKKNDPHALPTGINTIGKNWDEPKAPNAFLAPNEWDNRISSEHSDDRSVERYHFSDESVAYSNHSDLGHITSVDKSVLSDRRTLEINKATGTATYTINPDFGSRDIKYFYENPRQFLY